MQKIKWIFFAYLGVVALIAGAILASVAMTVGRDPQTLYAIYYSSIRSLDPAIIGDVEGSRLAGNVFETLYGYDYLTKPYKQIPQLAAEMPQISEDGLTWTIKLKKGIHYYDPTRKVYPDGKGDEITAADFFYAWKRIADFNMASQNYSHMLEGRIVGLDAWWEYTKNTPKEKIDWDKPVEGLQSPDPYTIVIKLNKPDPQLRYNLGHMPTSPVSRKAVKVLGDDFKFTAIGTGPYVIAEYLPEQRVVLERNPIYRGHPEANPGDVVPPEKRIPQIARVQYDYFEEDLPAWALFQQGMVDVSGIPRDAFGGAMNMGTGNITPELQAKGVVLQKEQDATIWFLGFNMEDPVVGKNKPLRQAMSMAFDRKRFIDLILNGRGVPLDRMIPEGFPTYDPNRKNPWGQYNLGTAKAKMREAEQLRGGPIPPITLLMTGGDTTSRQFAELVQQMMETIGVTIKVEYTTWARFQERIDAKQAQFYSLGWNPDYPDEQTFLQLLYSKNESPGPNSANYKNPEYDKLYERAIVMNPSPERDELYRQMETIALDDVPWILYMKRVVYALRYQWVDNIVEHEYVPSRIPYYTMDVAMRQRMQKKIK